MNPELKHGPNLVFAIVNICLAVALAFSFIENYRLKERNKSLNAQVDSCIVWLKLGSNHIRELKGLPAIEDDMPAEPGNGVVIIDSDNSVISGNTSKSTVIIK